MVAFVRCQDVKMSKMSSRTTLFVRCLRCQDVKMSTPCYPPQDVKMSKMPGFHSGIPGVMRCQVVKMSKMSTMSCRPGHGVLA